MIGDTIIPASLGRFTSKFWPLDAPASVAPVGSLGSGAGLSKASVGEVLGALAAAGGDALSKTVSRGAGAVEGPQPASDPEAIPTVAIVTRAIRMARLQ